MMFMCVLGVIFAAFPLILAVLSHILAWMFPSLLEAPDQKKK